MLPDGTWECGTKDAAIWFKPNGAVHLRRRSRSLKADWKSVAGRFGAVDENIKRLSTDSLPLYDREGNRVGEFGAQLDPVVFELASAPFKKNSSDIDLNLPNLFTALREMLSETEEHKFERKRDKLMRQINAAWAIKHRVNTTHQEFLDELKKLAKKLGHPPTKGELAGALGLGNDAPRMSQHCRELGYDWLPSEKPGPKRWKRRGR
jgi:hypothetical protein